MLAVVSKENNFFVFVTHYMNTVVTEKWQKQGRLSKKLELCCPYEKVTALIPRTSSTMHHCRLAQLDMCVAGRCGFKP